MVGFDCHNYNTKEIERQAKETERQAKEIERQAAEYNCLLKINSTPVPEGDDLYCEAKWDGWGCWNNTKANSTAAIPCPLYIPVHGVEPGGFAYHQCTADGEWWTPPPDISNNSWANYTNCIPHYQWENVIVNLYIAGYAASLVSLTVALVIFNLYRRQLRSGRISMHKHLFASYIGTSVTGILYYTVVAKQVDVLIGNPWWCQLLHVLSQYFVVCNFTWMFSEGLYLHTDVVIVFVSESKLSLICKLIGWVTPTLIALVYGLVRGIVVKDTDTCWLYDSCTQWILFGPIILSLVVNLVLLVNITRVLCSRLRNVDYADTTQSKRTARAAAVLIPLLGIQFLLFPVQPPPGTVIYKIFQTVSTVLVAFQGFLVSILFCYCNMEVIALVRRRWTDIRRESTTFTTFLSRHRSSSVYNSVSQDHSSQHRTRTSLI